MALTEHFEFSLADLEYNLPEELIAQQPPARRDDARLLMIDRKTGTLRDSFICDLPESLNPADLLILNDTRVIPARFVARRISGGRMEGLFVSEISHGLWSVMLERSRRLRVGEQLIAGESPSELRITLLESFGEGHWKVQVDSAESPFGLLSRIGQTPLPPYIHRSASNAATDITDRERYQTVYASKPGAVAAPTAGLHLTREILDRIHNRGVEASFVTLHVGVGTFKPISVEHISAHKMHGESYDVPAATADARQRCIERGGRVVAVGTTVFRVLESVFGQACGTGKLYGTTNIFIYPPHRPSAVDVLLTNFHLPRSTLLALVMAFAGVDLTRRAYQHAIAARYRFYSYGDAMLIL